MQEGGERERDLKKNLNRLKSVAIETDSDTIKIALCIVDSVVLLSGILPDWRRQPQRDAQSHQKQNSKSMEDLPGYFEPVAICKFGLNDLIQNLVT